MIIIIFVLWLKNRFNLILHRNIIVNIFQIEPFNVTSEDHLADYIIPEYTIDEIQAQTDAAVQASNNTPTLIWKKYLESVFAITDIKLDFDKDKILVADLDLSYMKSMAELIAKTPPVVLELYIWVQVSIFNFIKIIDIIVMLFKDITKRSKNFDQKIILFW